MLLLSLHPIILTESSNLYVSEGMDYYRTNILTREDVERLLDDLYEERGWDKKTSAPTPEKLRELGLEFAIHA